MNDINPFYSFLGICRKAGKISLGSEVTERMIKNGKAVLVIIAEDASSGTKKRFKNKCDFYNIYYLEIGQKENLGKFLGRNIQSVVSITDMNFKKKLVELAEKIDKRTITFDSFENGGEC